ncbi:hypothetical protein SCHPADRAFT_886155 [Schizopora paradoxa]|uniref:2OGFeDO JBP1/TET oxygenase domain-containing protein n=1 Tax=Schizopora paradoxa TaxID=27342 RepID=A0A0H2S3C0_9AGAM|nr:hypothetical protein SCHPADRAFT_886155 [Schizopora paradoxa]
MPLDIRLQLILSEAELREALGELQALSASQLKSPKARRILGKHGRSLLSSLIHSGHNALQNQACAEACEIGNPIVADSVRTDCPSSIPLNPTPVGDKKNSKDNGKRKQHEPHASDTVKAPKRLRLFIRGPAPPSDSLISPGASSVPPPTLSNSCFPSPSVSRASTPTLVDSRESSPGASPILTQSAEKDGSTELSNRRRQSTRLLKTALRNGLERSTQSTSASPDKDSITETSEELEPAKGTTGDARGAVQKLTRRVAFSPSQHAPGVVRSNSSIANALRVLSSFYDSSPELHDNATKIRDFIFGVYHLEHLGGNELWRKTDDLPTLANFLEDRNSHDAVSAFVKHFSYLCFTIKCHQLMKCVEGMSHKKIRELCQISKFSFKKYLDVGTKLAAIVAAGSPLMLVLVSCIENFNAFITGVDSTDLYNALFFVRNTESGNVLTYRTSYIPAINFYQGLCPALTLILLKLIPCIKYLGRILYFYIPAYGYQGLEYIHSHKITHTDSFFQLMCEKSIKFSKRSNSWDVIPTFTVPLFELEKLPNSPLGFAPLQLIHLDGHTWDSQKDCPLPPLPQKRKFTFADPAVIKLSLSLEDLKNTDCPGKNKDERKALTPSLREKAAKSRATTRALDIDELQEQVLHRDNDSESRLKYIDKKFIASNPALRIESSDGHFLVCVSSSMPSDLKGTLLDEIRAIIQFEDFQCMSSTDPRWNMIAYHLDIYFRYGTSPDNLPLDKCKDLSQPKGTAKNSFVFRTLTPHSSLEKVENEEIYVGISKMKETFDFLRQATEHYLPDEYIEQETLTNDLALNQTSPFHPFTGVVLNINCCSFVHRDFMDHRICIVVPFGNWDGGELVFEELGLVFELSQGDVILFRSEMLTHYNLEYNGTRGSLVVHSDSHLKKWPASLDKFRASGHAI